MICVYDILLNFNDEMYDFYDWNELDTISHFRKITLIRVSENFFNKIISKRLKVAKEFLMEIKGKATIFNSKNMSSVNYTSLFTNGFDVIGVMFNSDGKIIKLSRLLVNEELELVDLANNLKIKKIPYVNVRCNYSFNKMTRNENEVIKEILEFLEENKENDDLVNYLYYEWFDIDTKSSNAYNELIESIKSEFSAKHLIMRDILKSIKS